MMIQIATTIYFCQYAMDAASESKEQIREIMAKKTSVIRSLQFTFTKTILPAEGTKFEKEDDRCLYRIKSDRIFSSSNYKMYAERRDNKDQVIYCMSFDGKENYKLLPASNIPGRPGKDQLIVSKAGDFPTATGFFIAPRALYDAVYNVFYLDDMLQDETTKMDERNGLLIVSKSEGVFEGKAYLDPSREYAMVKSELIREGRPYVMTDISEFHELQVQGHRVSMPAKARTCVYNFEKPYQHTYDEEFVIEKIDVNEEYPEESFKLQPTGKGAFSLYDMTLQKGFVFSPAEVAKQADISLKAKEPDKMMAQGIESPAKSPTESSANNGKSPFETQDRQKQTKDTSSRIPSNITMVFAICILVVIIGSGAYLLRWRK